ncbi:MAG: hypothetical protein LBQ13_02035 [Endomicrobium sp.]|nr:hypothetical protein [Endomicrobium sp.]
MKKIESELLRLKDSKKVRFFSGNYFSIVLIRKCSNVRYFKTKENMESIKTPKTPIERLCL